MTAFNVATVVIGRNEGQRLEGCLRSLVDRSTSVVYVDSGSEDDSVHLAKALGCEVVVLRGDAPFTAARARNAGFRRARELWPRIPYVQFIDGDCEVVDGWLQVASEFLDAHPHVAAVCGRRKERHPERSVYNLLCDIEWDTPLGEVKACGGDVMMRTDPFQAADGFRENLIAGEEPELCLRLRAAGWQIWRLEQEMTRHDAAILRFGQWWKRAVRSGYAFAEGAFLHGMKPERYAVTESRRIWCWGCGMPLVAGLSVTWFGPIGLIALAVFPAQIIRLGVRGTRSGRDNWWQASFLVLGNFPELVGQLKFIARQMLRLPSRLIEYK